MAAGKRSLAEKAALDDERRLKALLRMERLLMAKEDLLSFVQVTMPDINRPDDPEASRYVPARHHQALAAALAKVEAGEWLNLIITMPPRHGKSELATRRFVPWFVGRQPMRSAIVATYSDEFAGDFGREIRATMELPVYRDLFPGALLRKGSKSADRLQTEDGGYLFFVGRGTGVTGRGADLIVVDDPIKDREEADSKAVRDKTWKWWQDTLSTRLLDESGRVVIIMTRWHEDDLVGRLTDPNNPHFVEEEAAKWRVLDLPALAREDDALGRAKGDPLWPARFGKTYLEAIKTRNPRGFAALYQGRPAPEEGDDFKAEWMKTYRANELPRNLRLYAASDHAIKTGQEHDRTCFGCGGVDEEGVLWILPTLEWGRWPPDETVEKMLDKMRLEKPITWIAENEHISGTMGPFLRRRMMDERVFCVVEPYTTRKDKRATAATARGLMQAGLVRFPAYAGWWSDAKDELLKFPNATHDDFVSFLSLLCILVDRMVRARRPLKGPPLAPKTGTMAWVKWQSEQEKRALVPAFGGY